MLEQYLIEHCSPTLAGIKTGSLFSCQCENRDWLDQEMEQWDRYLSKKGIRLRLLRIRSGLALIYVYRERALMADLKRDEVRQILTSCGYSVDCVEEGLSCLKRRLECEAEFPHEIGLFLGYPVEDVKGFIRNQGRNCKCTGFWKVYGDEQRALRLFSKYRKCHDVYTQLWNGGRSVWQLTVAA